MISRELAVLKERTIGCLLGAMVGDAAGMPFETMTSEQILNAVTPGKQRGKPVTRFVPAVQKKILGTMHLPPGHFTDDTELLLVVLKSLIACKGFSVEGMVAAHVRVLKQSTVGWGATTERGIREVGLWYASDGKEGRSPEVWPSAISGGGGGNGVAIRVAPIALFDAIRFGEGCRAAGLFHHVKALGRLTHPDSDATFCAWVLAAAIWKVFLNPIYEKVEAVDLLEELARELIEEVWETENCFGMEYPMEILDRLYSLSKMVGDTERIRCKIAPGFRAVDSVLYALGIFCSYPRSFKKAIFTVVNAGGDTDSVASMVGAMVGANCGDGCIPKRIKNYRGRFDDAFVLGADLFKTAQL